MAVGAVGCKRRLGACFSESPTAHLGRCLLLRGKPLDNCARDTRCCLCRSRLVCHLHGNPDDEIWPHTHGGRASRAPDSVIPRIDRFAACPATRRLRARVQRTTTIGKDHSNRYESAGRIVPADRACGALTPWLTAFDTLLLAQHAFRSGDLDARRRDLLDGQQVTGILGQLCQRRG
jgi:hypothetical protein